METSKDIKDIKYNNKRKKHKFGKGPLDEALEFVKKYVRYFAAGAIFILLIVVASFFMKKDDKPVTVQYSEDGVELFAVNEHPEVMTLIQQYYESYAAGDFATLQTLAAPFSEHELAYMELVSRYIDGYQNLTFYTKSGLDASSYLVNVYVEIKFAGVDTLAPGLDFFYVRTNEEGNLYIDNAYSEYNMKYNDNPLDVNIHNLINEHEQHEDLLELLSETTTKFNAALGADANLYTMLHDTIPAATAEWMANLMQGVEPPTPQVPETETLDTEVQNTETPEPETETSEVPESETPEPESEEPTLSFPAGTVITIDEAINVRKEMTTESALVDTLYLGEKVTVVQSYAEGWTKVEWGNKTGYIRTDLLQ